MSKVVVVGLGYVGLPLAVRAAEVGHQVLGVDLDANKVEALQRCETYIEDVGDERILEVISDGSFTVSRVVEDEYDIAIIAVPTPLRDGFPDLSYVKSAGMMLGAKLRTGAAVVLESTTYPGTTEGLLADALTSASGLQPSTEFHLGFSPERINPGDKVHTLESTPKIVSATTPAGLEVIEGFYSTIVETTVPVSSPRVAELAKVYENTHAMVNIALVNEISSFCHSLGIDVHEMLEAALTKGHAIARWTPGPGVGGHCIPVDPLYLAWQTRVELGQSFKFAELAHEINDGRPAYVVERAAAALNDMRLPINGSDVLVMGVAYKPNVGDMRESPAVPMIKGLLDRGAAVTVVDPHVDDWSLTPTIELEEMADELRRFSLVIIVTNHDVFDYVKVGDQAQMVLDCRNSMVKAKNVVCL